MNLADAGGDGRNSLNHGSEVDPLTLTELAATVFTWDTSSGTGTTTGTKSSAMQNVLFKGTNKLAFGGQAIFFTWPLESVNHLGDISQDTTGRAFILKSAIDWLRAPPKPLPGPVSNMLPADGSTTTTLTPLLSWTAGLGATSYVILIGPGSTLPLSPTVIPTNKTSYTILTALVAGQTYTWEVNSVNANGTTLGPIQTFIAHSASYRRRQHRHGHRDHDHDHHHDHYRGPHRRQRRLLHRHGRVRILESSSRRYR